MDEIPLPITKYPDYFCEPVILYFKKNNKSLNREKTGKNKTAFYKITIFKVTPFLWFTQLSSVGWRKETYKYQTWNQFRYCFICKCYIFIKSEPFQHALQATVSPKLTEPSFARFFGKTGQACRAFNLTTNKYRRSAGEVVSSGYQKVPFCQSTKGVSP